MKKVSMRELIDRGSYHCSCGKCHEAGLRDVIIESGAVKKLPAVIESFGAKKVYILADGNTWEAAGKQVKGVLDQASIPFTLYLLADRERIEPDEKAVGSVAMHFDHSCDLVLGVGSGVINDIGKIITDLTHRPYVIFGTAPSMDGYASGTSSVIRDGLKYSLNSHCPDVVVGDLDILCKAPMRMILSGLGDMLAKYISLAEWRISHIINGEYYCQEVADLISQALEGCMDNLEGIPKRDPEAIREVMNGMVLSGIAANYAGISRPVSGMEHYLSHICDMRGVEFGLPFDFHGIQCGAATIEVLKLYETKLRGIQPDRERAIRSAEAFSYEEWKKVLKKRLGNGADAMIENEEREGKYDIRKHRARLEVIIEHWDEIQEVICALPDSKELSDKVAAIGLPVSFRELGFSDEDLKYAILMSKDIRDKYVGSRLIWDLGL